MLIHFGVTPYLVFDGDYLPSKAGVEVERAKKRAENKRLGLELLKIGKTSQAYLELQKAIDVTPEMARQLIEELKRHNIKYVVAPYEADAQLAYLERTGIIQGVISEDSDLLVFGVKRLVTKLDQYGECIEVNRRDFAALKSISLVGWSDAEFRRMAILSGCDYLPNISKMGLKTAYRLVRKHKTVEKILRMLSFDGHFQVPPGYFEDFQKAELTFLHQRVFCPVQQKLVMLTSLDGPEPEDFDFVGKDVDLEIARGVATGDLNPMTKARIVLKNVPLAYTPSPWALKRSKTINSPADLKPKKPIDDFFKPKRIPLAELDPNSLTLSPSQQRLLEQHDGAMYSTPIHPLTPASAPTVPASEPIPGRVTRDRVSSGSSIKNPSKRQRLCGEESDADTKSNSTSALGKSRFFTSSAPEPSPSMNVRAKKAGKHFNLWSDDSLDQALGNLPELSTEAKVNVFCDAEVGTATKQSQTDVVDDSQTSTHVTLSTGTTILSKEDTPTSSATSTNSLTDPETVSVKPETKKATAAFLELSKRYLLPAADSSHNEPSPGSSSTPSKLPAVLPKDSPSTLRARYYSSRSYCSPTQMATISYPELSASFLASSPPAEPCTAVPESPEVLQRKTLVSGSEDYIVPCSDAESDGESHVDIGQPKSLDLGRFAFQG